MDALRSSRIDRMPWVLWIALFVILSYVAISYTAKAMDNRSAFLRWRDQVRRLDGGTDIYQQFQYPNPPIMALMLRPLAGIDPPVVGALVWFAIKLVLASVSVALTFRLIESGHWAFPLWAKALAVALMLRPLIGDLTHGNINILILFLVTSALFAFHRGRDYGAGLLLGLAICCKVTPLLFVPYFAWKRQGRVLIGTAAGMAIFLFVVPAVFLGWNENLAKLSSWTNQMVIPFLRDGVVTSEHPNQSLPGVVHRLLTPSPSFSVYPNGVHTPSEYHNLASLSPAAARWIIRIAQGAFMLGLMLLCRTRERGGWRLSAEFGFVLIGMLIFSERTWKHHGVTLAMPLAVLVYALAALPIRRGPIVIALVGAVALMLGTSSLFGKRGADLAQVYGVYLWAFLLLLAAIGWLLALKPNLDGRFNTTLKWE